jgi:glycosyltransferase involved in cell wall biosynthesis
MPTVDIILPFYNTSMGYVREALKSVFDQTYRDWKLVIINDGSSEQSTEELESLLKSCTDERIYYLKIDNRGPSGSRNVGIKETSSPYIAFLDSDDVWLPKKLEEQIDILEAMTSIDLVHSDVLKIDGGGQTIGSSASQEHLNNLSPDELFLCLLNENFVSTSTVMLRRHAGESVGFFDETFECIVDKDFWLRLLYRGHQFFYYREITALYRVHETNISKKIEKLMRMRLKLIKKVDVMLQDRRWRQEYQWKQIEKNMLQHAFREASEGYLQQRQYKKALRYGLPCYSGVSRHSGLLVLRSLYGQIIQSRSR